MSRDVAVAEPRTLAQLLRLLDVHDKTIREQRDPLIAWVAAHPISPQLWRSLVANGYGLLLEQIIPSFERPVPCRRITTPGSGTKESMLL